MTNNNKILIVDDEMLSREGIKIALVNIFKERKEAYTLWEAENTEEASAIIEKEKPTIVFLDIEMPNENGISFLARQKNISFYVIIITAYQQYALDSFNHHAQDYILKPFSEAHIKIALEKCFLLKSKVVSAQKYVHIEEMMQIALTKKIALPTQEGFQIIKLDNILYLKANGSYTDFILKDMNIKKICVSKNMKVYENILMQSQFLRVHDSYMINLNYVEKYVRGEGGYLVLEDGTNIDVSKRRKQVLLDILQNTRRTTKV